MSLEEFLESFIQDCEQGLAELNPRTLRIMIETYNTSIK